MATEIVHWCDVHLARDERHPVVARHTVALNGAALVLELCETCEVALFKPLAEFLTEFGVPERVAGKPVKTTSKAAGSSSTARVSASADGRTLVEVPRSARGGTANADHTLYPCLVCDGVIEGRSPYDRHLRDEHRTSHAGLYGTTCPVCTVEVASIVGLSSHAREHEVHGAFALFDLARQQGDPHGIVAARLATVTGA